MSILSEIVNSVERRVDREEESTPKDELQIDDSRRRSLKKSIVSEKDFSIIGELKKSSPSQGVIRKDFKPRVLAKSLEEGGVAGISILTEPEYFQGRKEYIEIVRKVTDLPILRKDFIIDEYQLYRTASLNADAVLLIAELLDDNLKRFIELAYDLNLEPLVEVRTKRQARVAEDLGAELIGINNRNLLNMEIDLESTKRISGSISENCVVISESGISSRKDLRKVIDFGADAVLIGTSIMASQDIKNKVRSLAGRGEYD